MKVRIITGIVMAIVGIPLLIFSEYIVFPIALSLLSFIAVFEMLRVLGHTKNYFISVPAYLIAAVFPLLAFLVGADKKIGFLLSMAAAFFAYLIYLFFVAVFMRGKMSFSALAEAYAAVTYITSSFTAISVMRCMENGIWLLVMLLVAAWGSDVFAYFTGMLFGKHKLIPEISPKKTIEGSVGGIVFATLGMILYGFILSSFTDLVANYIVLGVSAFFLSAVSQVGDLAASLIKREHNVKDYGNIFPGHGGVMDRFDSLLSITTPLLIVVILFPPFS